MNLKHCHQIFVFFRPPYMAAGSGRVENYAATSGKNVAADELFSKSVTRPIVVNGPTSTDLNPD